MPLKNYPSSYRLPDADYVMQLDAGVLRTPFENGHSRQRRRYKTLPTVIDVTFTVKNTQKYSWMLWWGSNAYTWFNMQLPTLFQQLDPGKNCKLSKVRCISDLSLRPAGGEYVQISCMMELSHDSASAIAGGQNCNWIIGGTPAAPASDTITGGTPAASATNTITAGTPSAPACPI